MSGTLLIAAAAAVPPLTITSVYLSSLIPCTFFLYCFCCPSMHGNDCLRQYLHSNTSRSNIRWCKRAHVLQELSLPLLIPFCELICRPLAATTTSTPLKTAAQLPPPHHPLMDQPATSLVSVETTHTPESLDEFVRLSPSTGDESEDEDSENDTMAAEEVVSMDSLRGGDNYIGGVVGSHVINGHSISSGDGDEKFSSERLFTANVVNIHPWVVALSRSICAPPTTELLQVGGVLKGISPPPSLAFC